MLRQYNGAIVIIAKSGRLESLTTSLIEAGRMSQYQEYIAYTEFHISHVLQQPHALCSG